MKKRNANSSDFYPKVISSLLLLAFLSLLFTQVRHSHLNKNSYDQEVGKVVLKSTDLPCKICDFLSHPIYRSFNTINYDEIKVDAPVSTVLYFDTVLTVIPNRYSFTSGKSPPRS